MDDKLKDLLLEYFGALIYEIENCHDWIKEHELAEKINAVNVLLGFSEPQRKTTFQKVVELIKNDQNKH